MNTQDIDKYNEFRRLCLANSKDLLDASAALLDKNLDHIAFHLIVLALEEIGKPEIVAMQALASEHRPDRELKLEIDDHEKKLFWAIWGPSFGRERITGQQIQQQLGLARSLHENRKRYLYADPSELVLGQAKMRDGEARTLFDFADVRHKVASASEGMSTDVPKEDEDNVRWFMETTSDPQRRKEIFGRPSQDKLLEFGDAKKWIRWLRETYDAHEEATRALIKEELTRQMPSGDQAHDPKWRVRVKLVTPSHAIRNKPLNDFNARSDYIKLRRSDEHTLIVEIVMPTGLPAQGLWQHGWGQCRLFATALNIGARGIFWWNVPVDTATYYEEIWDLERNMEVRVEMNPRLELNWKAMRLKLGPGELGMTSLLFAYLVHQFIEGRTQPFDQYVTGLSFFAKNDVHLRLELNALEEFYKAMKSALRMNGHWDGQSDLKQAVHEQLSYLFGSDTENMDKTLELASEVERRHTTKSPITIADVIAMKNYCDAYFLKLAKEYEEERSGRKLTFTVREDGDQKAPAKPALGESASSPTERPPETVIVESREGGTPPPSDGGN